MIDVDMKIKRALAAVCAFLFVAGIFLLGGCGSLPDYQEESELAASRWQYEEAYDRGFEAGLQYGQEDRESYENEGELLHGRRAPEIDLPSYVDHETDQEIYSRTFAMGFYDGYDQAYPDFMSPSAGGEKPEDDELDFEIMDEYEQGKIDGRLAGRSAGFDAGCYGTQAQKPANVGMSDEYKRGFDDGWAEGYAEGYQQGVDWKEVKEAGPQ